MFEFASASRSCSLATHAQFRRTTVCVMGMVVDEGDGGGGGGGDSDAIDFLTMITVIIIIKDVDLSMTTD